MYSILKLAIDNWNQVQLLTTVLHPLGRPLGDADDKARHRGSQTAQDRGGKVFVTHTTIQLP